MSYVSFGHLFEIKNVLSICTIQKLDGLCYRSVARVIREIIKEATYFFEVRMVTYCSVGLKFPDKGAKKYFGLIFNPK